MRVSREFKLGILMVLGILLFLITFEFLKGYGTFGKPREFVVEFDQAYGLKASDEVQVHGVKVGQVSSVDLYESDANKVVVHFEVVQEDLEIPKNSELWLISSDILGTKVLDLRVPHDSLIGDFTNYQDGDLFDPEYVNVAQGLDDELEAQFLPIKDKTEELVENVQDIILKVSAFWDSSAAYTYDASMASTRDGIEQYKEMTNNITNLVQTESKHIATIDATFETIEKYVESKKAVATQIITGFDCIAAYFSDSTLGTSFDESSIRFSQLGKNLDNMKEGNGTLGKLMYTGELKQHFAKIDSSITELKDHLDARPKDFYGFSIFGLKAEGYQPDKDKEKHLDNFLDSLQDGKKVDYK